MSIGNRDMESLIGMVNRLQDVGLSQELALPQIVAIGSQSAGKSSVLESIVGRDFLPRGAGVVTRRPIILQLQTSTHDYAEFLHLQGRKFTDADEIKAEIERATREELGEVDGISEKPITLRIYSPAVLNITLVDLPGMTKIAVVKQASDLPERIRNMVVKYVDPENVIILAVSPANADLATSDAMEVAREVDPHGKRTIGVVTKLDMMDRGTDARNVLEGKVFPLKLGYVGVVNRSQYDIDAKKDIASSVEAEEEFFADKPEYKNLSNHGVRHLQWKLNRELKKHISNNLPRLRADLNERLYLAQKEQEKYEDAITPDKAKTRMIKCIQGFEHDVKSDVQGSNENVGMGEIAAGPHINSLFYREFVEALALHMLHGKELKRQIAVTIKNIRGYHTAIFTPYDAFRLVIKFTLENFRIPIKSCVDAVATILCTSVRAHAHNRMERFHRLRQEILEKVIEHIIKQQASVKEYLMKYVDAEAAYQNIRHEDMLTIDRNRKCDNSPEYIKSVPTVRQDLRNKTNFHSGWLLLDNDSDNVFGTRYWFNLQPGLLTWYQKKKNEERERPLGALVITPQVKLKTDENEAKIILFDQSGGNLLGVNGKEVSVCCDSPSNLKVWLECLTQLGVENTTDSDTVSQDTGVDAGDDEEEEDGAAVPRHNYAIEIPQLKSDDLLEDHDLIPQVEEIRVMVESYLKIVNKTVRDMVPKYIIMVLVEGTLRFISEELTQEFLTKDPLQMLEDDGETERKYYECEHQISATRDALRIIDEVFASGGAFDGGRL